MRKIKIRNKYVGGGMTPYMQTDFNSQLPTQLNAPQGVAAYAPGNMKPTSSANFLQSSKFAGLMGGSGGSGGMGGLGQAGDAITSMIGNMTGPATASTVSESRMQTAMGTIQGTAKGAAAGFAVGGPIGGIVGAAAGLASGIVGKKGSVTTSSDMYDDQVDIKYGTGIRGGKRNRRKLRAKADQYRSVARSNQASLAMGQQNTQDFYEDYDTDVQTMAQGGIVDSLAYVDDGEILNTPQGDMIDVPEEGKPTDTNLVSLPEGTRILSDKRKVPGSKETYAQMGKRLMSKKRTTRKDKYAENATMLNEMNDQMIYDKLFAIQEGTKKKRENIDRFQDGGTKRKYKNFNGQTYMFDPSSNSYLGPNAKGYVAPNNGNIGLNPNVNIDKLTSGYSFDNTLPEFRIGNTNFSNNSIKENVWASTPAIRPKQQNTSSKTVNTQTPVTTTAYSNVTTTPVNRSTPTTKRSTVTPTKQVATRSAEPVEIEPVENELDLSKEAKARVGDEVAPYITSSFDLNQSYSPAMSGSNRNNSRELGISEFVTDLASLAPTISNMFAKPEYFNANYNPYEAQINSTMANRKFDISPAKRAIRENRAVSNYNAANYNPSTGANLAYRLQSQIASDKAISDLYSTASNINNQYKGEYANTLNSMGQQRVNATNMAVDMNARSRAAARNIQRTALTQLSQYAQNKQLMKNQKSRDMAMLEMYEPFLQAGYASKNYASFIKKFKKG